MLKTKCDAVKLEGGKKIYETVKILVKNKIPVMGHLGLLPQSDKTFKFKGKKKSEREKILKDAKKEFKKRTGGGINGKHWLPPLCDYKPPFEHRWPEYFYTKNKKMEYLKIFRQFL